MTIDEAIKKETEQSIRMYDYLEIFDVSDVEYHKQLAEWLEELKAIKDGSIPIIHGKAELELHDKVIRNKAIDDFIHECDKHCGFYSGKNKNIISKDILKIAEQLKAGD